MEENRQTKMRRLLCVSLIAILAAIILCWILLERRVKEVSADDVFNISLASGFYTDDQELTIDMPQGTAVYFTDNCELPDREKGIQYTKPVVITASEEEKIYVYRFKAFLATVRNRRFSPAHILWGRILVGVILRRFCI